MNWKLRVCLVFLALCSVPTISSAAFLTPTSFNIGQAGGYSVLGLSTTIDSVIQGGTVTGNVGVGPNGSLILNNGGSISGTVTKDSTASVTGFGGSIITQSMSAAIADAIAASSAFASASPAQTFAGNVTTTQSFVGNAGHGTKVINITGDLTLANGNSFTFTGNSTDYFIVNVTGKIDVTGGGSILLAGGLTADHVIFNDLFSSSSVLGVKIENGATANGTFLSTNSGASVTATLNGALVGDGHDISVLNGGHVNGIPIAFAASGPGAGALPEASPIAIWGILGAVGIVIYCRRPVIAG